MLRHLQNILIFFLLLISQVTSGQYYDLSFEHLTSEDGLSNDVVNSIAKDKTGFMWFATNEGLSRYDGINFYVIKSKKNDTTGLPSNYVAHMSADKNGWLWLTTANGLCRFNPSENKFEMIPIPGNDRSKTVLVSNVAFTSDDHAWFVCNNSLYKVHISKPGYKKFDLPSSESYYTVAVDKKSRVWLVMRNSIYRFIEESATFKYYDGLNNQHPDAKVLLGSPAVSSSDTVFFTSYGGGFYFLDEKTDRLVKWKTASHLVSLATEDYDENGKRFFWCVGGGGGLMIYDPVADKYHELQNNSRDPYSHNATECPFIFKDPQTGTVWIATRAGIEKYDPFSIRFKRKFLPASFPFNSFSLLGEVVKDKTDLSGDTYWVGSWALGLFKWSRQNNEFTNFNMKNGLLNHEVFHVTPSRFGYLIIACREGLQLWDPRAGKPIKQIKGFMKWPISKKILYAMEDHEGNIWMVANYDGIYEYILSTGEVKHWNIPGVVPEKGPYVLGRINEDAKNRIWISGVSGNIHILTPATGEIKTIDNNSRKGTKIPGDVNIVYINERNKEIWASGTGNFLARLNEDGEVMKLFRDKDGEGASGYNIMIQDPLGFMWTNAANYIQRIDITNGNREYFDKDDGLISSSGIYGATITDDGELFLGFQFGFSHINTKKIPFNTRPPVVAISNVKVNYSPRLVNDKGEIVIHPKERVLTLEFAALNYSQPKWNQYAYLLEGYDKNWVYGNDNDITLMNLGGGTHYLYVKASNNDGVWGEETVVKIKVIPPFFKTIWFKLLIAAVLGGLLYLVYMNRKQQKRKLERIRNRIATDLHDDMGSTLSSIRIFSDVAKKQIEEKPDTVQLLDRISNNATSLSENMQDIIWTIRSDNDTLEDLVSRMREFGMRVCDAKQIRFNVKVSQNFKTSRLNLEQRRNLYLIFKEAINNAVKYADPTEITLFLSLIGRYLKMEVEDDGKGFEVGVVTRGNGLNNLEKRAKDINGNIEIESKPGEGTKISLIVVLKRKPLTDI